MEFSGDGSLTNQDCIMSIPVLLDLVAYWTASESPEALSCVFGPELQVPRVGALVD